VSVKKHQRECALMPLMCGIAGRSKPTCRDAIEQQVFGAEQKI
jgi:hypothetical protein